MKEKNTQILEIQRNYLWMAERLDAGDIQQKKKTVDFFAVVAERTLIKSVHIIVCIFSLTLNPHNF